MGATKVQYGQTNYRINREPIDAESVITTYSGLEAKTGLVEDAEGALYPGMIVAVTEDQDTSLRGPYYISYEISESGMTYVSDKLSTQKEVSSYLNEAVSYINENIEESINELMFNWGVLE